MEFLGKTSHRGEVRLYLSFDLVGVRLAVVGRQIEPIATEPETDVIVPDPVHVDPKTGHCLLTVLLRLSGFDVEAGVFDRLAEQDLLRRNLENAGILRLAGQRGGCENRRNDGGDGNNGETDDVAANGAFGDLRRRETLHRLVCSGADVVDGPTTGRAIGDLWLLEATLRSYRLGRFLN